MIWILSPINAVITGLTDENLQRKEQILYI